MEALSFSGASAAKQAGACATSHDALLSACQSFLATPVPGGDGLANQTRDARDLFAQACQGFLASTNADYRSVFQAAVQNACAAFDAADAQIKPTQSAQPTPQTVLPGLAALQSALEAFGAQTSGYGSGLTELSKQATSARTAMTNISGQIQAKITSDNAAVVDAQTRIAKDQAQIKMDAAGTGPGMLRSFASAARGEAESLASVFGGSSFSADSAESWGDAMSAAADVRDMNEDIANRRKDIVTAQAEIAGDTRNQNQMTVLSDHVAMLETSIDGLENALEDQQSDWEAFTKEIQTVRNELQAATSRNSAELALVFFRAAGKELKIVVKDLPASFTKGAGTGL
jgi:predicted  nucleic acid-binding Zn-ribbon protein